MYDCKILYGRRVNMNLIKSVFKSFKVDYLVRQYVIGLAIFIIFLKTNSFTTFAMFLLLIIDLMVFPFVNYLWCEILNFITGSREIFYSINLLYLIYKVVSKILLYIFGFAIFPIALLVIMFRTNMIKVKK